jgi:hypothetical protein
MPLSIGQVLHHAILNEKGRILRVAKLGNRSGYVVAIADKSSAREIEALWLPREIREVREHARRIVERAEAKIAWRARALLDRQFLSEAVNLTAEAEES